MNFLARATRYIRRKPTKTILLMITFFVIGNLVVLGMGISSAAENAKKLTRQQMRAAVSYEVDYMAYYNYIDTLTDEDEIEAAYRKYPSVDVSVAQELAKDERIKAFNYMDTTMVYPTNFEHILLGNEDSNGWDNAYSSDGEDEEDYSYRPPSIAINANMYPETIEITEGTQTIVEGRFVGQDDLDQARHVGVITKELAEQNGLRIGDTIRFTIAGNYEIKQLVDAGIDTEPMYEELEIVGIYDTLAEVDPNSEEFRWMSPYQSPKNVILMPLTAYQEYARVATRTMYSYYMSQEPEYWSEEDLEEGIESVGVPSRVIFLLNDPLEVDDFIKEKSNQIGEFLKLDANNDQFKKLARPLDTLSFFANVIVWIVVINAIVIISLVTALTLKTREFEIGVLLSIGVSKAKIILQLFMELIIIALLGFTLAVGSGSLMAERVGEVVLDYQQNTEAQYEDEYNGGYYYWGDEDYFTQITQDDLLSQYRVTISPGLIGIIYLLGSAVVLVAIVVPSFMIMRLNPKQILLEQN